VTDSDSLTAPIDGADHQNFAGAQVDVMHAGAARVKRIIYPAGLRWSTEMKPLVGTELCMHGHVGFLARGHFVVEYPDGCVVDFVAPTLLHIEPEHDGYVAGDEPAVLIQFDFEKDTNAKLGLPERHSHD
jgi:hypothetical protein